MLFKFGRGFGRGRGHRVGGRGRGRGQRIMNKMRARNVPIPENCICPHCGTIVLRQMGIPCFQTACPKCGSAMTRQFNIPGGHSAGQHVSMGQKPVINENTCTGCRKCIPLCPQHAIEIRNKKVFISPERCTNCRICISACPESAIS